MHSYTEQKQCRESGMVAPFQTLATLAVANADGQTGSVNLHILACLGETTTEM